MDLSIPLAIAAGIALSAACGLRAFLPLLAVSGAARLHYIPLAPGAAWLADDRVLIALSVATVIEILADKIPVVDHAMDAIATLIRPVAAAVGAYALLQPLASPWDAILALIFGGGALVVHAAKAKTRLGSTAFTLGVANPFLSFLEDGLAFAISAAAILLPIVALAGIVGLFFLTRAIFRRRAPARA